MTCSRSQMNGSNLVNLSVVSLRGEEPLYECPVGHGEVVLSSVDELVLEQLVLFNCQVHVQHERLSGPEAGRQVWLITLRAKSFGRVDHFSVVYRKSLKILVNWWILDIIYRILSKKIECLLTPLVQTLVNFFQISDSLRLFPKL